MTLFLELVPNLLNPYIVLIVGIGSGINVFLAVLLSCAGSAAGSMIGFEVGKKYGLRFVQPFFRQKSLEKIFDFWKKYGKWFVFAAALTPLPYVPLIFGAFGMKRKDFLIFGIAARLAGLAAVGFAIYFGFL
jgi:undecaprenyl-diphosphatase